MIVNFSNITYDSNGLIERPVITLHNTDESIIGTIGDAYNIKLHLCFNDISELTFDVPADSIIYDKLYGNKYLEIYPFGKFIIMNPKKKSSGVEKYRSITAYSLEYELQQKRMTLAGGTYNFHNSINGTDTITSIIEESLPSWNIIYVSSSLINKFRTFDDIRTNVYDFMMNTLQKKFNCCFSFDTYNRKIYVYDTNSLDRQTPIYLSLDNLLQNIDVEELSKDAVTCLYVTGADGVDIRSMNPMGTNKIYNLDWMFQNENCSPTLIAKWNNWKTAYGSYQDSYKAIRATYNIKNAELQGQIAKLFDMKSKLSSLEDIQATLIEHIATGADRNSELTLKTSEIEAQQAAITVQEGVIESYNQTIETITSQMKSINEATKFTKFFSESEWKIMQNFIIESELSDSTFVATSVDTYNQPDVIGTYTGSFNISGSTVESSSISGLNLHDIRGGLFSTSLTSFKTDANNNVIQDNQLSVSGEIVSGILQLKESTKEFVLSLYLNSNTTTSGGTTDTYPSGNITIVGTYETSAIASDINISTSKASLYLTRNVTEYQTMAIEEDLYNYAATVLSKLAEREFEFNVDSVNFLFAPEYEAFKNSLSLGSSIYLDVGDMVVTPTLLEAIIDYDNPESYTMKFCNSFRRSTGASKLIDVLQDISHTTASTDFSKFNYDAYVKSGAQSAVKTFMNSALDASKNMLLASENMAVSFDHTGLHLRKKKSNSSNEYEDQQIWGLNNMLAYTDDGFSTVKLALGEFIDPKTGKKFHGLVAPNIVGTLLAGESCIIESENQYNGISQLKVDGTGVKINNASLTLTCDASTSNTTRGQIVLDPRVGFAIGSYGLISRDSNGNLIVDPSKYKLYLDNEGNVKFKGILEGAKGSFSGSLSIGGTDSTPNYYVDSSGNLAIGGSTKLSTGAANPSASIYMSSAGSSKFTGTVNAKDLQINGVGVLDSTKSLISAALINLKGANVNGADGSYFSIDANGNVSVGGNLVMKSGTSISWGGTDQNLINLLNDINTTANNASNTASNALNTANNSINTAYNLVSALANGQGAGTFISGTQIASPTISGGVINGATFNAFASNTNTGYFLYDGGQKIASINYDGNRYTSNFSSQRALYLKTEDYTGTSIKLYTNPYDTSCGVSVEGHHIWIGASRNNGNGGTLGLSADTIDIWGTLLVNGSPISGSGSSSYATFA